MADLGGQGTNERLFNPAFALVVEIHTIQSHPPLTHSSSDSPGYSLWDFRRKWPLMTSRTFRGSAAVPRKGLIKDHAAHMPGEWAHSRSRSRRQGLSKRNPRWDAGRLEDRNPPKSSSSCASCCSVCCCSSSLDTACWGCTTSPIWRTCCCRCGPARRLMFVRPPYPTTGGLSLNIFKPLVNRLRPLPCCPLHPLPGCSRGHSAV